jgi:hypothetical protein
MYQSMGWLEIQGGYFVLPSATVSTMILTFLVSQAGRLTPAGRQPLLSSGLLAGCWALGRAAGTRPGAGPIWSYPSEITVLGAVGLTTQASCGKDWVPVHQTRSGRE